MKNSDHFLFGVILGFALAMCISTILFGMTLDNFKKEAVKSNAAYWKVNEETGNTKFTWKHLENKE